MEQLGGGFRVCGHLEEHSGGKEAYEGETVEERSVEGGSAGVKLLLEGWASGGLLSERLVRNVVGGVGICGFERSCCW